MLLLPYFSCKAAASVYTRQCSAVLEVQSLLASCTLAIPV